MCYSDGTLNPNGVRFGSSEIYNIVEAFTEVDDSVCVGYTSPGKTEEDVVLFLKMAEGTDQRCCMFLTSFWRFFITGQRFSSDLVKQLRTAIRQQLSARHIPSKILPIADIPVYCCSC